MEWNGMVVTLYSDSEVAEADETMTCPLLLMRERSVEWAWFNQCDVTLSHSLLAALLVAVCLLVVHVTSVTSITRSVHDSSSSLTSARMLIHVGTFLPRDAMLAQYLLSSCVRLSVRPSVCHKPVLYRNDWTNRAGFGMETSFHLSHTVL